MKSKVLKILGGIVLVLAVAGGSFYGGVAFQRARVTNAQTSFFASRGGAPGGEGFPGGGGPQGGGGFPFGGQNGNGRGGTFGDIKSIDGNTFTISTPQSEVKVTLTDSTTIQKLVAGASADLKPGDRIVVRGETDSSGNVTATSIQITAAGAVQTP